MQKVIDYKKLIILLLPLVLIGPLAMDIYLPALPFLKETMSISTQSAQWTLSIFMLGFGLCQLFVGTFSARLGSLACLSYGLIIYFSSSLCISFTSDIGWIILLRFFQAVGACLTFVLSMGLVTKLVNDPIENLRTYSVLTSATGLAPILAPILGAVLLAWHEDWHIVFTALSLFSLLGVLIYFIKIRHLSVPNHANTTSLWTSYKLVISRFSFWRYAFVGAAGMSILFTFFSIAPHLLMTQYHLSNQQFSLVFGCVTCFFMIGSIVTTFVAKYFNARQIILYSYGLLIFISAPWAYTAVHFDSLVGFIALVAVINFTVGLTLSLAMSTAMCEFQDMPDEAASVYGFQQFVIAFLVGTVFIFVSNFKMLAFGIFITVLAVVVFLMLWKKTEPCIALP